MLQCILNRPPSSLYHRVCYAYVVEASYNVNLLSYNNNILRFNKKMYIILISTKPIGIMYYIPNQLLKLNTHNRLACFNKCREALAVA